MATRHGWDGDEFSFAVGGRHLAWGRVDQPPLQRSSAARCCPAPRSWTDWPDIDAIGPAKRIILVTCHVPRSWQDSVNRAVSTVAARNLNVAIADWNKAVTGHETLLRDDGVHPGPEGGRLYADTIATALSTLPAAGQ
ncbi:hypothetical protein [Streptomyces sp. YGL11-2]|uniref:hypothetical protein n=1 Tax=Streptomyces sp. YGL11-2 TaxID=3414028 RepID=UPI003CE7333A